MDIKYIAFIGTESYDVALLLGTLLEKLGSSLTVVDATPKGDLALSAGIKGQGSTYFHDCLVVRGQLKDEDLSEYVVILANENLRAPLLSQCSEFWMFTDFQLQNMNFCKSIKIPAKVARFLVLSTSPDVVIPDNGLDELLRGINVRDEDKYSISTEWRYPFMFDIQNTSKMDFYKMPTSMIKLLTGIVSCDYDKKEISAAFKKK